MLADETARTILSCVADGPQSAKELRVACEASQKTIYRRLEDLQEAGLVSARSRVDEDGNHYTEFLPAVEEVSITVDLDDSDIDVSMRDGDEVDRLIGVWATMRE